MIYTVTFNPSLDYVIQVDDLTLGEVNRTTSEKIYPGGKGNNVSVILSNLGHKSKALGFKAGFTGEQMETMLEEFGCYTDFIPLEEKSPHSIPTSIHAFSRLASFGNSGQISSIF